MRENMTIIIIIVIVTVCKHVHKDKNSATFMSSPFQTFLIREGLI